MDNICGITGIVAEYNPFHNGHLWQLKEAARLSGGGRCVAVMSGGFVQRGEPALLDKFARAKMALCNGVSVVIELPAAFACAGAEAFARGAVRLLSSLNVARYLCFGAETDDLAVLRPVAEILASEPAAFKEALKRFLGEGMGFARARLAAVRALLGPGSAELDEIMRGPNNILALEYLSAILKYAPDLIPLAVKRRGAGHDSDETESRAGGVASASYIRGLALSGGEPRAFMPPPSYEILFSAGNFLHGGIDKYSSILHYILLNEKFKPYPLFCEINNFMGREQACLWRRIAKKAVWAYPVSEIVDAAATRRFTRARVRRGVTRRILGLYPEDYPEYRQPAYARVLGFRRRDEDILALIVKNAGVPVVTNLKNARRVLAGNDAALRMLGDDLRAQALYNLGVPGARDEFSQPMVIV